MASFKDYMNKSDEVLSCNGRPQQNCNSFPSCEWCFDNGCVPVGTCNMSDDNQVMVGELVGGIIDTIIKTKKNMQTQQTMSNQVHPLVMNWLDSNMSMTTRAESDPVPEPVAPFPIPLQSKSLPPDWSMWSNVPMSQNDFNEFVTLVNSTPMMKSRIERINNNRNLDWNQKTKQVESILRQNGQIRIQLQELNNRLVREMNMYNQSQERWGFGIECRGCAADEACCYIVAVCIILLILL